MDSNSQIPDPITQSPEINQPVQIGDANLAEKTIPSQDNIPEPKINKSKRWMVIIIIVILLMFIAAMTFYLVKSQVFNNQPSSSQNPVATQTEATPTPDPTVNWQNFTSPDNNYSFKYPEGVINPYTEGNYKGVQLTLIGPTQAASGRTQTELSEGLVLKTLLVSNTDPANLAKESQQKDTQVPEGDTAPQVTPIIETTIDGVVAQQYSIGDGGNAVLVTFFPIGSDTLRVSILYAGFTNDETMLYRQKADQILSSFKFTHNTNSTTPTSTNTPTTISYSLPNGWQTTTYQQLSVGYDPNATDPIIENNTLKLVGKNTTNSPYFSPYSATTTISIKPYNNGSRHQFIYDLLGFTPTSQDKGSDYTEKEYLVQGKSCLVLYGLSYSQFPTTWGMCVISTTQAISFSTFANQQKFETLLGTLKFNSGQ